MVIKLIKMNDKIKQRCFMIAVAFVLCHILIWNPESGDDSYSFTLLNIQSSLVQSAAKLKFVDETLTESCDVNKVVIGTHFCRNGNSLKGNKYYEQTLVMIKSVLISAKLYNVSTLEIHLFLDHVKEDEKYFREEIEQNMSSPDDMEQQVKVKLKVYSAVDAVPKKYRARMVNDMKFRCGFMPFFYQKSLSDVNSIIHLNSENIVTGNIQKHWELLCQMNNNQMVSMGYHRQPENDKYVELDSIEFKDVPHIPPKAVNSDVAVMNLTRMREFGYLKKTLELFDSYSKKLKKLNHQQLANILIYHNAEILQILPCHLNFLATDCQKGFFCQSALDDNEGLHLVNGNSLRFMENQVFHPVYKSFLEFDVSDPNANFKNDLIKPILRSFSNLTNRANNQCYGSINKVIFKSFLGFWDNMLW